MKTLHRIKKVSVLILLLIFPAMLQAQEEYMMELGVDGGGSFYMGDANTTLFYRNTESAFGVLWRYNFNTRYSLKVDATRAKVSGDTRTSNNVFPLGRQISFGKDIYNVGGQFEFNFNGYGYNLRNCKRFSPYIFAGLGVALVTGENSTCFGVNLPFGVGVKYKLAPRLNIGLEFSMHKFFSDKLDDVGGSNLLSLADPYEIKSSWLKNKDWYSFTMVSISYDFMSRVRRCNNN